MHTGWRASFPISLWEGGSLPPGSWLLQQLPVLLHIRQFATQAHSHEPCYSREFVEPSKAPSKCPGKRLCWLGLTHWFLTQKQKGMMTSPMTTDISAMGNQLPFLPTSDWGNETSVHLPSPCHTFCKAAVKRHQHPTAQDCATSSSPLQLLDFSKNNLLSFRSVIFPGQQLTWDTAWSWMREVASSQLKETPN